MKKIFLLITINCIFTFHLLGQNSEGIIFSKIINVLKHDSSPSSISLQTDGNLIIAGSDLNSEKANYGIYHKQAFWKFNPNGELIKEFGEEGVLMDFIGKESNFLMHSLQLNDESIINTGLYSESSYDGIFVSKRKKDGSLDTTFGEKGFCKIDFNKEISWQVAVTDIKVLSDLSLIVSGLKSWYVPSKTGGPNIRKMELFIVKILSDGTFDNSFGNAGIKLISFDKEYVQHGKLAIDESENILLCGIKKKQDFALDEMFLMKFLSNGELDNSFGKKGILLFNGRDKGYTPIKIKFLSSSNKLLIIGKTNKFGGYVEIFIQEIDLTQTMNTDIEQSAVKLYDFDENKREDLFDVLFLKNGGMLLYGKNEYDKMRESFFALLNPDKSINTDFGEDGYLTFKAGDFKLSNVRTGCLVNQKQAFFGGSIYENGDWNMFVLKLAIP